MVLVNVEDLKKELDVLMKRKGVTSWMQTAIDAQDILWIIEGTPEVDATRHGQWIEHGPDWLVSMDDTF